MIRKIAAWFAVNPDCVTDIDPEVLVNEMFVLPAMTGEAAVLL
jgi:hypothetical protein